MNSQTEETKENNIRSETLNIETETPLNKSYISFHNTNKNINALFKKKESTKLQQSNLTLSQSNAEFKPIIPKKKHKNKTSPPDNNKFIMQNSVTVNNALNDMHQKQILINQRLLEMDLEIALIKKDLHIVKININKPHWFKRIFCCCLNKKK